MQHIERGDFAEVSHFITMVIMVEVHHVLICFIDCFLAQVFQKIQILSIEVGIRLIVYNQNTNKGHGQAMTNIKAMR